MRPTTNSHFIISPFIKRCFPTFIFFPPPSSCLYNLDLCQSPLFLPFNPSSVTSFLSPSFLLFSFLLFSFLYFFLFLPILNFVYFMNYCAIKASRSKASPRLLQHGIFIPTSLLEIYLSNHNDV